MKASAITPIMSAVMRTKGPTTTTAALAPDETRAPPSRIAARDKADAVKANRQMTPTCRALE